MMTINEKSIIHDKAYTTLLYSTKSISCLQKSSSDRLAYPGCFPDASWMLPIQLDVLFYKPVAKMFLHCIKQKANKRRIKGMALNCEGYPLVSSVPLAVIKTSKITRILSRGLGYQSRGCFFTMR